MAPFFIDLDHGRRYATVRDFENVVKLGAVLGCTIREARSARQRPAARPGNRRVAQGFHCAPKGEIGRCLV
jgi:trimethylamine:corrinoid methyltransferase-like protein